MLLSIALVGAGGCTADGVVAEHSSATTAATAVPTESATPTPNADRQGRTPETDEPRVPPSSKSEPATGGERQTIRVFFSPGPHYEGHVAERAHPCTEVVPVQRQVRPTKAIATAALNELFKGPTREEQARGLVSFFGPDTAGLLRSIRVEYGVAYVDLEDISGMNNVTTSCGSAGFLSTMDATLKQFPTIKETVYTIEGDPLVF